MQKKLLGLYDSMEHGRITDEEIRADLQKIFPDWNIPAYVAGDENEVIYNNACAEMIRSIQLWYRSRSKARP